MSNLETLGIIGFAGLRINAESRQLLSCWKTVPQAFRKVIEEEYPKLGSNKAYWRLMRLFLFSTYRDKVSGKPIIDQYALADCEEQLESLENRNYSGEKFLKAFKRDVMPHLEWTGWDAHSGHARVAEMELSVNTRLALADLYMGKWASAERVAFDTGKPWTSYQQMKLGESLMNEAMKEAMKAAPEVQGLLRYLNELKPNVFTKAVVDNLGQAYAVARGIEDRLSRECAIDALATIEDYAKPLYKPSGKRNTVRVFPLMESMASLQKDVRRALTRGWYEADLKSSQLAICSKIWDVPKVRSFLEGGGSVWVELGAVDSDTKEILKDSLYSLMYGGEARTIASNLDKALGAGVGNKFMRNWLIAEMYAARKRQEELIKQTGYVETCFGKRVVLSKERTFRSLLAEQAQSVELWLLLPVLDLALSTIEFQIVLWQHDGFSITFRDDRRSGLWREKISEVVETRAREEGIPTKLEWLEL